MSTSSSLTRDQIFRGVIEILEEMTADWDDVDSLLPIRGSTQLMADLGSTSIDVVMLIVGIEDRFDHKGLPFEGLLMIDGRYVDDLTVDEIADFLVSELATHHE